MHAIEKKNNKACVDAYMCILLTLYFYIPTQCIIIIAKTVELLFIITHWKIIIGDKLKTWKGLNIQLI